LKLKLSRLDYALKIENEFYDFYGNKCTLYFKEKKFAMNHEFFYRLPSFEMIGSKHKGQLFLNEIQNNKWEAIIEACHN